MTIWQRRVRLSIAVFAVGFAVVVVFAFKRGVPAAAPPPSVVRTDPEALIESSGGRLIRVNQTRENVTVEYQKQLSYKDGSTKLVGVKVVSVTRDDKRGFTVTGQEASVGQNDSKIVMDGDVRLQVSDGLSARTDHATYVQDDGTIRAPGPVEFSRQRMSGSGVGMTYNKNGDTLVILEQAKVRIASTTDGEATEVTAGGATLNRRDRSIRFERQTKTVRPGQVIEADSSVAFLTEDEERVDRVELHGNARITGSNAGPGALQSLTGHDMELKYAADGETLEHAVIIGEAVLTLAGQAGAPGRQINANNLDITLGPDGTTPVALAGRDGVQLLFPADQTSAARTIRAASLDARGEPGKGLTSARFTGEVDYREKSGTVNRVAKAALLDLTLKPGMSSIDEAKFTRNARFAEDDLFAVAATARYVLEKGTLELSGSEPGALRPHLKNDSIVVDAARIDVTLVGPQLKAAGEVRSVLLAKKAGASKDPKSDTKMPSMLKGDQPVYVVGDSLEYDGTVSKAAYAGKSKLWQADTTVQGDTVVIDGKSGDLMASGSVATSSMLEERHTQKKTRERARSIGTSMDFKYEEATRRATYTGDAHLSGSEGDMTATKIELYLEPSGDELDKAEAYDALTLREQNRKTTGTRMTYTADDETYVVTGLPVTILDECGRETVGRKLTFVRATDTVNVDGSGQIRTQTKGGSAGGKCP
jgi:LPS export ABC transporter protein LptC